ncbi:hypothetical protein [Mesorhizobium caraganae]|uniref:hypothetical protein n=1 Tax=Mesorhizobium caraganae TaxID=483206 RepID=UPI003ECC6230
MKGIIIALNVGAHGRKSMPLLTILDKRSLFEGFAKGIAGALTVWPDLLRQRAPRGATPL